MASYAERLQLEVEPKYDFTDPKWVTFIKDHRDYILSASKVVELSGNVVNSFRYHMTALLLEQNITPKLEWIIMWLNQIKGGWEVVELDRLIVPSEATISTLWDMYLSFKSKTKST